MGRGRGKGGFDVRDTFAQPFLAEGKGGAAGGGKGGVGCQRDCLLWVSH